jgi:hypothetical protein
MNRGQSPILSRDGVQQPAVMIEGNIRIRHRPYRSRSITASSMAPS